MKVVTTTRQTIISAFYISGVVDTTRVMQGKTLDEVDA